MYLIWFMLIGLAGGYLAALINGLGIIKTIFSIVISMLFGVFGGVMGLFIIIEYGISGLVSLCSSAFWVIIIMIIIYLLNGKK